MRDPAPGMLLIARPMVHAATFRRTVLLICEHSEQGSFGLILNRMLDLTLDDVIGALTSTGGAVSLGGPVQMDTLHFLHRLGEQVPGGIQVLDGVTWGGDFEAIKSLLEADDDSHRNMRFFMGYAGWGPGQLNDEIEQEAWVVTPAEPAAVFSDEPEALWRQVLRAMGGDYAIMANFPEDPRLN